MKNNKRITRTGFTLLELIVTTAMLAALTTSCMVVVRTAYSAWNRHEDDHELRQQGLAVLKHIVRQARQSTAVVAISSASDNSGSLSLLDVNGDVLVWEHDAGSKEVRYGVSTATNVLATNVEELTFVGMKVDDTTATTDPGLIHTIDCTTKISIARPAGPETVTTSCRAWLRAW